MSVPTASRATRALALASAGLVCALAAGALAITVLGKVNRPGVSLDLSMPPPPLRQLFAPRPNTEPTTPPVTINKKLLAGEVLVADPALIENSPLGPLPRIADDGRTPMEAYAAPAAAGKFRIAIVVSGLGLSPKATAAALDSLPTPVNLAFAPYAADVQHWVSEARRLGHEVLLEVPMEPQDFPDSDPGPHTLRSGVERDTNPQRLNWALSRFTGYAGVTNLLGRRFLADAEALSPIMTELARRGLYFYDNDAASQSAAADVAGQSGTAFADASGTLDGIQAAAEIDKQLSDLESGARTDGSAIGSASLYPVSLARIALWAKGLEKRGFVLVPVSAIVRPPGN
jgi:uncharacterized protein